MAEDDFNRLYERLVGRRTNKKKRVKPNAPTVKMQKDEKILEQEAAALEAARLEERRRKEQQERDAKVVRVVKRLKLGRNLRGFARQSHCSSHRLAVQLVTATEQDAARFREKYQRVKSSSQWRQEGHTTRLKRCMRLEALAARLYLDRAVDFRPDASSTLEGKHRVIDELLFFSPISSKVQSQIGYAEIGNVVPPPPNLSMK